MKTVTSQSRCARASGSPWGCSLPSSLPLCGSVMTLDTVRTWALWQTEVERGIGPQFARREVRRCAWAYIRGLLSPIKQKSGWQLAEGNGDTTPYGVQHLLGRAIWDADALRNALRSDVVEPLGALQAVLVVDE